MHVSLLHSPFGSLTIDGQGMIVAANLTLAKWLGCPLVELEQTRFDTLLDGGGRLYFQVQCLPLLQLKGEFEEVYLSFRGRSGEQVPMLINATSRENGMIELAVVRMSRRAQLEDDLVKAKRQAEQADTAKVKFLAMMSHELRTPLQTITLSATMLQDGYGGPVTQPQTERLRAIQEASSDLLRLIGDILDFAQMNTGQVEVSLDTLSTEDVLIRAETLMTPRLEEAGINYVREPTSHDHYIRGDAQRVQQVLLNLLSNALKFTPKGGQIAVRTTTVSGKIGIEIEDTGCGIDPQNLERIFEAFIQVGNLSSSNQGVGLGLAISRDLTHAMGGELHVRSTPGSGSTFSLLLAQE